jgi:hypothetical protein
LFLHEYKDGKMLNNLYAEWCAPLESSRVLELKQEYGIPSKQLATEELLPITKNMQKEEINCIKETPI